MTVLRCDLNQHRGPELRDQTELSCPSASVWHELALLLEKRGLCLEMESGFPSSHQHCAFLHYADSETGELSLNELA